MTTTLTSRHYRWWVVFMLWFVCLFDFADRQAITSVFSLLGKEFGFNKFQLGWIGSIFACFYAAGGPIGGFVADRFSRRNLILAACVIWSLVMTATAWCGGLVSFLVVRALLGVSQAVYFPAAMSLISDYHGPRTRSRALAWHVTAVYAGSVLGSWLAAELAQNWGWRVPFWLFGPPGILVALVLLPYLREPARGASEIGIAAADSEDCGPAGGAALSARETLRMIYHTPAAMFMMGATFCQGFVGLIFYIWMPIFLLEKFHYSLGAAGLAALVYIQVASSLAAPLAGWLADSLRRRFQAGRVVVLFVGMALGSIFIFFVGHTAEKVTLLSAMMCYGVCKGFYEAGSFAALFDVIRPPARGTAAGIMNAVNWSGGALGPLVVGAIAQYGRHASSIDNMSEAITSSFVVYGMGALLLVGAALTMSIRPRAGRIVAIA